MPDADDEEWSLEACKYCSKITLDRLADRQSPFRHAPTRSSLVRSAQKCRLCSLFFRKDRSRNRNSQLCLSLEAFSEDDQQIVLALSHLGGNTGKNNTRLALSLYTTAGDPAAEKYGITAKTPLTNTASEATFETIRSWLQSCLSGHSCSRPIPLKDQAHTQAARLLDLDAFEEGDLDVKLIDNNDKVKRYATLSYCWGKSRAYVTTTRSLRLRQTRIDYTSLPKTFKDAIRIARKLSIRYLWIDACCIIQDDVADWQRESAKMGSIYSTAYITIAAEFGTDSSSGCFNEESSSQELAAESVPFELASKTSDGRMSTVYIWDASRGARKPTPPEIDNSSLSERGWVCQERILSARILHYTKSQLFWECRQCLLAEDGLRPWSLSSDADTVPGLASNLYGATVDIYSRTRLLDIWYQNVIAQSYSRRKLTRPEDKLTAISGLARAFHRHFRSRYIAGLWEMDLAYALTWRRKGPAVRPAAYRAPSFSWACLDAIIEWPVRPTTKSQDSSAITVDIHLESSDPFGRVSEASLIMHGQIRRSMVVARKRLAEGGYVLTWELRSSGNALLGTVFMDSDDLAEGSQQVDCLILDEELKTQALILERLSSGKSEFVRKGVAELLGLDKDDEFFESREPEAVVIL